MCRLYAMKAKLYNHVILHETEAFTPPESQRYLNQRTILMSSNGLESRLSVNAVQVLGFLQVLQFSPTGMLTVWVCPKLTLPSYEQSSVIRHESYGIVARGAQLVNLRVNQLKDASYS